MELKCIYKSDVFNSSDDETEQVFIYRIPDHDTFISLYDMTDEERCRLCGLEYETREYFDLHPEMIWMMHRIQVECTMLIVVEMKGFKK